MNNLIIEQSQSSVESINAAIIEKLYELAKTSKVQNANYTFTMSLKGNVSTPSAYEDSVTYLRQKFPELIITVQDNNYYIRFKDSKVEEALVNAGIGDSLGVSVATAANATIGTTLRGNTEITSFDEFKYFTKDNNNPAENMFKDCTNLESIDLSNITAINKNQFTESGIKIVNAPNLTQILGSNPAGHSCFGGSQVEEVVNLGHISYVPDSAFMHCFSLESVVLPDECYELRINAFRISQEYVNSYGSILQSIQGLDHISNFGGYCMYGHRGLLLTAEDIKEAVKIDGSAFWYTSISSINCKKLSSLGESAFRENTALTTIECLGTISSIPLSCFSSDSNLQTVKLPYECISISGSAFNNCPALTSVTQYNKSINDYEEGEEPTFLDLSRITSYGNSCFNSCSLLRINAANLINVTSIGSEAFRKTQLYGNLVFNNLQTLGYGAFEQTQITSLDLSNTSLTTLPRQLCLNCSLLQSIILPSQCKVLERRIFIGCISLVFDFNQLSNIESMEGDHDGGVFSPYRGDFAIQIQNASNLYLPNLKHIELRAFTDQLGIVTVNLPSLQYMDASTVFAGCTNLEEVISLGEITEFNTSDTQFNFFGIFERCSNLTTVNLPNVRNLPERIFMNTPSLINLNLPSTITSIGSRAFLNTLLTNKVLYFPNVTKLSLHATFASNSGFHIYLPQNLEFKSEYGSSNNTWKNTVPTKTAYNADYRTLFYEFSSGSGTSGYIRTFYLKNISNIIGGTFYNVNIDIVVINNTTIPTLTANTDNGFIKAHPNLNTLVFYGATNIGAVYVPDSAVNTYKNSSLFANVVDKIKPLSECPRITVEQAEAGNNGIIEAYM